MSAPRPAPRGAAPRTPEEPPRLPPCPPVDPARPPYAPFTPEEDAYAAAAFTHGFGASWIGKRLGRPGGSVGYALHRLGLHRTRSEALVERHARKAEALHHNVTEPNRYPRRPPSHGSRPVGEPHGHMSESTVRFVNGRLAAGSDAEGAAFRAGMRQGAVRAWLLACARFDHEHYPMCRPPEAPDDLPGAPAQLLPRRRSAA